MFTYLYLVERRVVLAKVHAVRATARPLFGSFFLFAFVGYLNNRGTVGGYSNKLQTQKEKTAEKRARRRAHSVHFGQHNAPLYQI